MSKVFNTFRHYRILARAITHEICSKTILQRTRTLDINHSCRGSRTLPVAARALCTSVSSQEESPPPSPYHYDNLIPVSSLESPEFKQCVLKIGQLFGSSIQDADYLIPAFLHKSYLISHGRDLKKEHTGSEQLALLGYQTIKRFIAEHLYLQFPDLSAQQIWDLEHGIFDDIASRFSDDDQFMKLVMFKDQEKESMALQAVASVIGSIYIHEGPQKANDIIRTEFISELSEEQVQEILKLQHPKYILKCLTEATGTGDVPLKTVLLNSEKSDSVYHLDNPHTFSVTVFLGEDCLSQATNYSLEKAERKACQQALLNAFQDQLRDFSFSYDDDEFLPEDHIDLGLQTHEQRVIELEKGEEPFGFNIKGGEKKRLKNEQWLIFRYYSPVFIASINPGGLADRQGGLQVGDVLLAVNDRSLVGLDHAQAIRILQAAKGTVTLTVKHDKEVLITDKIESKYKDMKRRKLMAELSSEDWTEWHQAHATKNPGKYAHVLENEQNQ